MSPYFHRFGLSFLLALAALQAQAHTAPANPASASMSAAPPAKQQPPSTPLPYKSAFDGYQPFADAKPVPWKDANSTVETVGGWRAYAKEAPKPPTNGSGANGQAPATTKPANPHAGHGHP